MRFYIVFKVQKDDGLGMKELIVRSCLSVFEQLEENHIGEHATKIMLLADDFFFLNITIKAICCFLEKNMYRWKKSHGTSIF